MRRAAAVLLITTVLSGCYSLEMRKHAAQLEYEKGMRLFDGWNLRGAKKAFEHTLWLDPNHQAAKVQLRRVRWILGDREPYEWEIEELDKIYGRKRTDR